MRSQTGLRLFLTAIGVIAIVGGAAVVIFGATSVVGVKKASPALDSEMRFFATWYVAAGLVLATAAQDIERRAPAIRGVVVTFGVAGLARGLSWATVGRPPWLALTLMAIELLLPLLVLPWLARARYEGDELQGPPGFG